MSAHLTIEEARFFLELLDTLDQRKRPLTHLGDTAKEASFLFSAILNAFYSTMAIMRDEEGIDVADLLNEHPEIYALAKKGGERAKTVHVAHTLPAFSGYIRPQGNNVNFHHRKTPVLIEEAQKPGQVDLAHGPNHYMKIQLRNELIEVSEFCYEHLYYLRRFYGNRSSNA